MTGLDEELRRGLTALAPPVRGDGVAERVVRRGRRMRIRRLVARSVMVVSVVAGTSIGLVLLRDIFGSNRSAPTGPVLGSPVAISPHVNGLLAYTTGDAIVVARPDGTIMRRVPSPTPGLAWHIAWSPDGSQLAVAVFDDPERSLWVIDADGSNPVELASAENVGNPSWSPNGAWIAYTLEQGGTSEVHVTRPDGTDDRVIRDETAAGTHAIFSASFSPEGTRIVFDSGTELGYDIFVMDADGSNVRRLTDTGSDYNPSWSTDGTQIVFTRQEAASESDIFVMDADGSNVRRLTDDGPHFTNLNAVYAPDGRSIVYEAARNGGTGPIVRIGLDGSGSNVLVQADVLGFSWQSREPPGPDGVASPRYPGLGYAVCHASLVPGEFGAPQTGTWMVATKLDAAGGCSRVGTGSDVILLDADGDGSADTDFGPLDCRDVCSAMAAPDVDGDGVSELMVAVGSTGGSIEYELFASLESGIERMAFDCQHCNAWRFAWGRPEGHAEGAYCVSGGDSKDFVVWNAERIDDGTHYGVVERTIDVTGRVLTYVDRSDTTVPYDLGSLPSGGGDRFCGVNVLVPE